MLPEPLGGSLELQDAICAIRRRPLIVCIDMTFSVLLYIYIPPSILD